MVLSSPLVYVTAFNDARMFDIPPAYVDALEVRDRIGRAPQDDLSTYLTEVAERHGIRITVQEEDPVALSRSAQSLADKLENTPKAQDYTAILGAFEKRLESRTPVLFGLFFAGMSLASGGLLYSSLRSLKKID